MLPSNILELLNLLQLLFINNKAIERWQLCELPKIGLRQDIRSSKFEIGPASLSVSLLRKDVT